MFFRTELHFVANIVVVFTTIMVQSTSVIFDFFLAKMSTIFLYFDIVFDM